MLVQGILYQDLHLLLRTCARLGMCLRILYILHLDLRILVRIHNAHLMPRARWMATKGCGSLVTYSPA